MAEADAPVLLLTENEGGADTGRSGVLLAVGARELIGGVGVGVSEDFVLLTR